MNVRVPNSLKTYGSSARSNFMVIFLLALIGTLVVMAVFTVGRLWFCRRETLDKRKFFGWFLRYSIFNYLFSLFILYFFLPALTGPFWGWQWVLWPLLISSLGNLFALSGVTLTILESSIGSSRRRSVPVNSSRSK